MTNFNAVSFNLPNGYVTSHPSEGKKIEHRHRVAKMIAIFRKKISDTDFDRNKYVT